MRRRPSYNELLPSPNSPTHKATGFPRSSSRRFSYRVTRQRFALVLFLAGLVFWRYASSGVEWSGVEWKGEGCVKSLSLPSPPPDADTGAETRLYTFPPEASPFEGRYKPVLRKQDANNGVARTLDEEEDSPLACLDDNISKGARCEDTAASPSKLDVVWAYVNGSDHLHQITHRTSLQSSYRSTSVIPQRKESILREFDELRYSVRSVLKNFRESASRFLVIAPEYPFPGCRGRQTWNLGQVPQWLTPHDKLSWSDGHTPLYVMHHSRLFGGLYDGPTFNSLAIESRLAYLEDVSDVFIYTNDDVFFARQLTTRDFYSPGYGPVFRLQPDLLINPNRPKVGEWASLQHTNELLNARFGLRSRPYVAHTAKTLTMPFLKEVSLIWGADLDSTAGHPHRIDTAIGADVSITVLMTHYVIEKWRETLLWSFIVASIGGDDDQWGEEQTLTAWIKLGGDPKRHELRVRRDMRETLLRLNSQTTARETHVVFSSYDGYPYAGMGRTGFKEWPDFTTDDPLKRGNHVASHCNINMQTCFQVSDHRHPRASEIFKNVAYRNVQCGDCIVSALMSKSGRLGLGPFLPDRARKFPTKLRQTSDEIDRIARLPLTRNWELTDYTLRGVRTNVMSVRQWVLQALYRYRFVIGSTPSSFVRLETPLQSNSSLYSLDNRAGTEDDPALICINDDVRWQPEVIREMFEGWMKNRWGTKAAWEN